LEIEAKFSIPHERMFQRLLETSMLAGFEMGDASVAELHDRYLDTANRAILAGGYACRIRCQNERYLATVKGLGQASGGIHRRIEHETVLPESLPPQDWPPGPIRDLIIGLADYHPLVPLFEIEQTRHSRSLCDGDRAIAELNLDHVHLCQEGIVAASFLELEAELLPAGTEDDLARLVSDLESTWGLTPENRSKFERGLSLFQSIDLSDQGTEAVMEPSLPSQELPSVELLDKPGIEPDDPMSEAGRKTFRFHYRRMVYNEPGTRLGEDIEALHDMRVATRRMRAAFRVFGDYYEPRAVAPYRKGLKRTGRALGRVRDLDVFRDKIQKHLATLPESQQDSLDALLAELEVCREAARERMVAYFDGKKYARFKERFGEFVETEGLGSLSVELDEDDPWPYRVRQVAPVAIYQRLAEVRAYDEWVSTPSPPLKRLHALRIACKMLRYTMEFFREALGPDAKTPIKEVVVMQDHLGELQDTVVAGDILRSFQQRGTWGPDMTQSPSNRTEAAADPGVNAYLAFTQTRLQHLLDTFPQAWQRLKGPEFSHMVAEAVAVL
jgi:CHAD domain-containing protein